MNLASVLNHAIAGEKRAADATSTTRNSVTSIQVLFLPVLVAIAVITDSNTATPMIISTRVSMPNPKFGKKKRKYLNGVIRRNAPLQTVTEIAVLYR